MDFSVEKNYVFDARISVAANNDILGKCALCEKPYDDYANCMNASCNKHFICCPECLERYKNTCSSTCLELINTNKVMPRPPRIKIDEKHSQNNCSI